VLTNPARLKGWEAFVNDALNAKTAQDYAMAFAILPMADIAFVKAQNAHLQNGLVFLDKRQFAGKKWTRHNKAGDALSEDELKALPQLFSRLENLSDVMVLWDKAENNLIYLIPTKEGRFYKIPIRFKHNQYGGLTIDDVSTVFKIKPLDASSMLNLPEIERIR